MNLTVFFDRIFDKNRLKRLVRWTFDYYGLERSLELSERLKNFGFRIAAKTGISLGVEDMSIPKEKRWATQLSRRKTAKNKMYENLGTLTFFEATQTLVKTWVTLRENLKDVILELF
jgi:DNA-directed RNA polymerase subunit beta'